MQTTLLETSVMMGSFYAISKPYVERRAGPVLYVKVLVVGCQYNSNTDLAKCTRSKVQSEQQRNLFNLNINAFQLRCYDTQVSYKGARLMSEIETFRCMTVVALIWVPLFCH